MQCNAKVEYKINTYKQSECYVHFSHVSIRKNRKWDIRIQKKKKGGNKLIMSKNKKKKGPKASELTGQDRMGGCREGH